jgi:hypothetical protein
VAPFDHVPPRFSGDHSPIRGRSVTIPQTRSGGAETSLETDTRSGMVALLQTSSG